MPLKSKVSLLVLNQCKPSLYKRTVQTHGVNYSNAEQAIKVLNEIVLPYTRR